MKQIDKYTTAQQQRIKELSEMSPQQWDSICKCCGVCCMIKLDMGFRGTAYTNICCSHLDRETKLCNIYQNRISQKAGNCKKVTLDIVMNGELLPDSCGYREYIFGPVQYPARVNFATIEGITDKKLSRMKSAQLLSRIIPESFGWSGNHGR